MQLDNRPGGLPDITTYPAGGMKIRLRSANGVAFPATTGANSVALTGTGRQAYPETPVATLSSDGLDLMITYSNVQMMALAAHGVFYVEYYATIDGDYEPFDIQKVIFSTNPSIAFTALDIINVNVNGAQLIIAAPPPGMGNAILAAIPFNITSGITGYPLPHNQNTRWFDVRALRSDGALDEAVRVRAKITNGVTDLNNAELIYPRDGTFFTGTLLLICYYNPA